MKHKITALCVVIAMLAVAIIGGTMAYFTDTDEAVNVMTLGNVKIEQNEYEWNEDGTELVDFTQAKPLFPYVGTVGWKNTDYANGAYRQFTMNNALDKYVTVENTGKSDAYVRTIFAFEMGELTADEWDTYLGLAINAEVGAMYSFPGSWNWEGLDRGTIAEIDGHKYMIYVGTHKNALAAGEETVPSLLQVYMTNTATNEIVEKLDGNGNGTYDILVVSQAVQAAGFADAKTALDTAFGKITTTNHPWTDGVEVPIVVTNDEELQDALDNAVNGDIITLGADIEGDVTVTQKAGVKFTIDGNGKTIDGSITVDGQSKRYDTAGVTIKNVKFSSDNTAPDAYINLGVSGNTDTRYTNNVTVSNCTFNYSGNSDKAAIKSYTGGDYNLTVEGCTVNAGMHSFLQLSNIEKGLTVTGCKVYSKNGINLNYTPYLNMSDCEFDTVGYCVRIGVNGSTNSGNFTIAGSTLKSANDDGDAVIILRGTMTGATLNLEGTTLTGTLDITGTANIVR